MSEKLSVSILNSSVTDAKTVYIFEEKIVFEFAVVTSHWGFIGTCIKYKHVHFYTKEYGRGIGKDYKFANSL